MQAQAGLPAAQAQAGPVAARVQDVPIDLGAEQEEAWDPPDEAGLDAIEARLLQLGAAACSKAYRSLRLPGLYSVSSP